MDLRKSFEEFLIRNGYKQYTPSGLPSTVYEYINGVDFVREEECLLSWSQLASNIGKFVCMYDVGGRKEALGEKGHKTIINSLKRFREFLDEIDYQDESYSKTEANFSQSTKPDNIEIKPIQKYAGVGSTVIYRILEDNGVNQVTIVEPANKKSDKEVSKTSELGESLLYRKEGEVVKVNSSEPYTISILHISNPINNVRYEIQPKEKSNYSLYAKQNNNHNMQANSKLNKYGEHNMTNAEEQRKIFWETFEDVLMENGEPFSICYMQGGKPQSWANVNRNHAWNANAIDLSFLNSQGLFRVDLYMQNGELDHIGRIIMANKEKINLMVTQPIKWERGERNPNTLRPSVYFPFKKNNKDDYRRVIEESLPTILEFIEVANKYGKNMFFDF